MPATVVRQVFLGGNRDYMVEAKDGTQLRVLTAAGENIPQGSAVWLHLPPERCRALGKMTKSMGETTRTAQGGKTMIGSEISRRDVLIGSSALVAGTAFSTKVMSAAPPASAVTPALIEAAKKEGKVVWYTSVDLQLSEQIGKAFEAKYPGVSCEVERTGAERLCSASGRNTPPTFMRSTWSTRRMPRT